MRSVNFRIKRSNKLSVVMDKVDSLDERLIKIHQVDSAWNDLNNVYSFIAQDLQSESCLEWKWMEIASNINYLVESLSEHKSMVTVMDNSDASCHSIQSLTALLKTLFLGDNTLLNKFEAIDEFHYEDISLQHIRKADECIEQYVFTHVFEDFTRMEEVKTKLLYTRFKVLAQRMGALNLNQEVHDFMAKMLVRAEELLNQSSKESHLLSFALAAVLDAVTAKGPQYINNQADLFNLRFKLSDGSEMAVKQVVHFHQNPVWDKFASIFSKKFTNTEKALGLDHPFAPSISNQP